MMRSAIADKQANFFQDYFFAENAVFPLFHLTSMLLSVYNTYLFYNLYYNYYFKHIL